MRLVEGRFLDRLQRPLQLSHRLLEPVRAPDSMDGPAEALQDLLSQPVAVAGPACTVVGRAIALNAEQVTFVRDGSETVGAWFVVKSLAVIEFPEILGTAS